MAKKSLQLPQLHGTMQGFVALKQVAELPGGGIKAIRTAMGMLMQLLGNRLSVSKQGILDREKRERDGAITIRALKEISRALDMQLGYGFVPNDGSWDALI